MSIRIDKNTTHDVVVIDEHTAFVRYNKRWYRAQHILGNSELLNINVNTAKSFATSESLVYNPNHIKELNEYLE